MRFSHGSHARLQAAAGLPRDLFEQPLLPLICTTLTVLMAKWLALSMSQNCSKYDDHHHKAVADSMMLLIYAIP